MKPSVIEYLIQGMALFGFIVNEVGAALGNMRQRRANLEKDIFNSEKISSQYELNSDLGRKVRDYVINNQIAQEELGISEENDFLMKLNEELRNCTHIVKLRGKIDQSNENHEN